MCRHVKLTDDLGGRAVIRALDDEIGRTFKLSSITIQEGQVASERINLQHIQ